MSTNGERAESPASSAGTSTANSSKNKDVTQPKRKSTKNSKKGPVAPEIYVVEKIVKKVLLQDGTPHYWIKWKGWTSVHNTWEPVSNLTGCPELLEKFEKQESLKKKSTTSARKKTKGDLESADEDGSDEEAYKPVSKRDKQKQVMGYGVHHAWPSDRIPNHMMGAYVIQKRLVYLVCCEDEFEENRDPVADKEKERYTPNNVIIIWGDHFRELYPHIVIAFYEKQVKWVAVGDEKNKREEKAAKAVQDMQKRELEPPDDHSKENVNPNKTPTGDEEGSLTFHAGGDSKSDSDDDEDELMDIDDELNDKAQGSKDFDKYGLPESMESSGNSSASGEDGYD